MIFVILKARNFVEWFIIAMINNVIFSHKLGIDCYNSLFVQLAVQYW